MNDSRFLHAVDSAIFKVMESQNVSVENIASELCITSQQLRRRIKSMRNQTSVAYIALVRLQHARKLLSERHELTIEQIGLLCGFDEATNFTRFFKKETGMTPSQYRESL